MLPAKTCMPYDQYMKVSPEVRKVHSDRLRKRDPECCPTLINFQHSSGFTLPNCKYTFSKLLPISAEAAKIRETIVRLSNKRITEQDSLFFLHGAKIVNCNALVKEFLQNNYTDLHHDGWLHLAVYVQETF